jgi:hypothetical protein
MMHNRFPLGERKRKDQLGGKLKRRGGRESTYKNHNRAELPSGFLVNSTPSSIPTGKSMIEPIPIMTKIAKRPPVLCGLTRNEGLD